jgi:hypothetical protein
LLNVEASLGQHGGDGVEKILGLGVGSVPATQQVKGTVSRDRYFFGMSQKNLISSFSVCADGFQDPSKAFLFPIQLLSFCLLL